MAKLDTSFSSDRVKVVVDNIQLTKFGESFITLQRMEDRASLKEGAGGDSIRIQNPSESGTLEVSLQFDSPQIPLLDLLCKLQRTFEVFVTDLNTGSSWTMSKAFISTDATVEFSKDEPGDRSYTIVSPRLTPNPVGALSGLTV